LRNLSKGILFGGNVQKYKNFSRQFAFASSKDGKLKQGGGCVGDTTFDPLDATFNQVYNGELFYVIWNDQFYGDPICERVVAGGALEGYACLGQGRRWIRATGVYNRRGPLRGVRTTLGRRTEIRRGA